MLQTPDPPNRYLKSLILNFNPGSSKNSKVFLLTSSIYLIWLWWKWVWIMLATSPPWIKPEKSFYFIWESRESSGYPHEREAQLPLRPPPHTLSVNQSPWKDVCAGPHLSHLCVLTIAGSRSFILPTIWGLAYLCFHEEEAQGLSFSSHTPETWTPAQVQCSPLRGSKASTTTLQAHSTNAKALTWCQVEGQNLQFIVVWSGRSSEPTYRHCSHRSSFHDANGSNRIE